jgi:hypothetical protein
MGKHTINNPPHPATTWTHGSDEYHPGTVREIPDEMVAGLVKRGVIGKPKVMPPSSVPTRATQEYREAVPDRIVTSDELNKLRLQVEALEFQLAQARGLMATPEPIPAAVAATTTQALPLSANAEVDKFKRDLADSLGNGAPYIRAANSLVEAGYTDYDKLFAASNDELMDVDNVGNSMIASIRVLQRQLTPDLE